MGIAHAAGIHRPVAFVGMAFGQDCAIKGIGEPDAAIGMGRQIVGRVERLALEIVGQHRHRAIHFPAHHAAEEILAGELAALIIETVAVGVEGRLAESADFAVVPEIAIDRVILDVAEDRVLAFAAPGRTFGEMKARRDAMDHFLADQKIVEAGIDLQHIGIGRDGGLGARSEFARRLADHRARRSQLRFALRVCERGNQRGASGDSAAAGQSICHVLDPPEAAYLI